MAKTTSSVTNRVLANLLLNFENDFYLLYATATGEKTGSSDDKPENRHPIYYVEFESKSLKEDCRGTHVDIIVSFPELKFRRDCDV
jgi:hypothetical protein